MKKIKRSFWFFLLWLTEALVPLQIAEAKGGIFGSPIFSIITTIAAVAISMGALAPVAAAVGMADTYASVAGTIASITSSIDGAVGFSLVEDFGVADTLLSLGTASACLSGSDVYPYSGCGGGSNNNSAPPANTQAAIQANTLTRQGQAGSTYTCPTGYNLDPDTKECIPQGYISCAPAGHPELLCPSNTSCTSNGQCQGSTVSGGSCNSVSGSTCSSAPNSCGMTNQATYECNGSCPAVSPSDSSCTAPTISISEEPTLVNPGSACTVSWTVQNATSCTLSSNGNDSSLPESASIPSGNYNSPSLRAATTYTLSCMNGKVVSSQLSVTCHINPQFNEI